LLGLFRHIHTGLTAFTLFFEELVPKALAVSNSELVARKFVPIISRLSAVLLPFTSAITGTQIGELGNGVGFFGELGNREFGNVGMWDFGTWGNWGFKYHIYTLFSYFI
jgi:hypothetical protein